jgi:hypothetical protein
VVAAVLVFGFENAAAHRLGLSHSTVKHCPELADHRRVVAGTHLPRARNDHPNR